MSSCWRRPLWAPRWPAARSTPTISPPTSERVAARRRMPVQGAQVQRERRAARVEKREAVQQGARAIREAHRRAEQPETDPGGPELAARARTPPPGAAVLLPMRRRRAEPQVLAVRQEL